MIEIGEKQRLKVIEETENGVYLAELEDGYEKVLLPNSQVPEQIELDDVLDVFIYKDSEDRIVATKEEPKVTMGQLKVLEVVAVTEIGAFLDWGLPKDLFLPFREQSEEVKVGNEYLVGVYLDISERLCATMKISSFLDVDSPYKEDDKVKGTIYSIADEIGAFVAIDNKYEGMIPEKEIDSKLVIGSEIEARVTNIKEDGKIDLSLKEKAYKQMKNDADILLDIIEENGGELYLNDKSSPEEIRSQVNMSKNAFKRAVGGLLKDKKIEFSLGGIKKI